MELEPTTDSSEPLNAADTLTVQQITGVFLYYARVVDPTILTTVSKLSSALAHPTKTSLEAAYRLCNYAVTWPNATIIFRSSKMQLIIHSDASHLGDSESR
jgi:hypothetical protein